MAKLGDLHNRKEAMFKQRITALHDWRVASPSPTTASEPVAVGLTVLSDVTLLHRLEEFELLTSRVPSSTW